MEIAYRNHINFEELFNRFSSIAGEIGKIYNQHFGFGLAINGVGSITLITNDIEKEISDQLIYQLRLLVQELDREPQSNL